MSGGKTLSGKVPHQERDLKKTLWSARSWTKSSPWNQVLYIEIIVRCSESTFFLTLGVHDKIFLIPYLFLLFNFLPNSSLPQYRPTHRELNLMEVLLMKLINLINLVSELYCFTHVKVASIEGKKKNINITTDSKLFNVYVLLFNI